MRDPELVSRAHQAAMGLERAWEHWRIRHGLSAARMPPISSYVGYSIEEPSGRPRVVFGVDAHEAELLAALLEHHECTAPGCYPRGQASVPAQAPSPLEVPVGQSAPAARDTLARPGPAPVRAESPSQPRVTMRPAERDDALAAAAPGGTHNGTQERSGLPEPRREPASAGGGGTGADATDAGGTDAGRTGAVGTGAGGSGGGDRADGGDRVRTGRRDGRRSGRGKNDLGGKLGTSAGTPAGLPPSAGAPAGLQPARQPKAQVAGGGTAEQGPAETTAGVDRGTGSIAAELAGWASGELPGQASARLAAWEAIGGVPATGPHPATPTAGAPGLGTAAEPVGQG